MVSALSRLPSLARRCMSVDAVVLVLAIFGLLGPSLYVVSTALADQRVSVRIEEVGDSRRVVELPINGILWRQGLRPGMTLEPMPDAGFGADPSLLWFRIPGTREMRAVPLIWPATESPVELFLAGVVAVAGVMLLLFRRPAGVLFAAVGGVALMGLRWPIPVGESALSAAAFLGPPIAILVLPFAARVRRDFRILAFGSAAVALAATVVSIWTEAVSPDTARMATAVLMTLSAALSLAGSAASLRRELGMAWDVALVDTWIPGAGALRRRSAESERRRIASDIHAELIPGLVGVANMIDAGVLSGQSAADEVRDLARDARELMLSVRPPMLDTEGLAPTVEWLAQRRSALSGTPIDLDCRGDRAPAPIEDAAYRIAELALDNALRHGRATHVTVTLRTTTSDLSLTVADDGVGFDPDEVPSGQHVGLRDMRRIAHEIGGQLSIRSDAGTAVDLRWSR